MAGSPGAGLAMMDDIAPALDDYYLFHAARADLLRRAGDGGAAEAAYRRALRLARNAVERRYLERRLTECRSSTGFSPS